MPRGSFNSTCDLYNGPLAAVPGAFVGSCACRLVIQDAVFLVGADAPLRVAYLTLEDFIPVGSWLSPAVAMSSGLADRVAVPSGDPPNWWVLYTEAVLWGTQPIYWRANLVELPAPHLAAIAMESTGLVMMESTSYILME